MIPDAPSTNPTQQIYGDAMENTDVLPQGTAKSLDYDLPKNSSISLFQSCM